MTDAPENDKTPPKLPAPPLPPRKTNAAPPLPQRNLSTPPLPQRQPLNPQPNYTNQPPPTSYSSTPAQQPVKVDVLAILSLVLNFVSLSLVSIILGHIALKRTHKGRGDGHGIALAGTIIGYVFTLFIGLGVAAAVVLPIALNQQKEAIYNSIQVDVKDTVSEIEAGTIPLDQPEKTVEKDSENIIYVQTDGTNYVVLGGNESVENYVYWYDSSTQKYTIEDTTESSLE